MPVQDHRVPAQGSPEAAHRQGVGSVTVDDVKRGGEHQLTGDLAVTAVPSVSVAGGGVITMAPALLRSA